MINYTYIAIHNVSRQIYNGLPKLCSRYSTSRFDGAFLKRNKLIESYFLSLLDEIDHLHQQNSKDLKTNSRLKFLQPIYLPLSNFKVLINERNETENIIKAYEDGDRELYSIGQSEINQYSDKLSLLQRSILTHLLTDCADDDKGAILEVFPGVGGEEAMLFSHDLFMMYNAYAIFHHYHYTILSYDCDCKGALRYGSLRLNGTRPYGNLKYEGGVHRVQRIPQTEKCGRIHTSTAAVSVLPQPSKMDLALNEKDLKVEACRASGKGGQNVNKANSAVRIVHLPTGVAAECQMEREQHKNREIAMEMLRSRLYKRQQQAAKSQYDQSRKVQVGSVERSEKIRTYNYLHDRITDHRIGRNYFGVSTLLQGQQLLHSIIEDIQNAADVEQLDGLLHEFRQKQCNQ